MKRLILSLIFLTAMALHAEAQGTAEAMAGQRALFYQHALSVRLSTAGERRFSHVSSANVYYDRQFKNEIMSQSYLMHRLSAHFSLGTGFFYVSASGFRPSLNLQYLLVRQSLTLIVTPRVDVWTDPAMELFLLAEFRPPLTPKLRLYTRLQAMSSHGTRHHNRSYQQLRLGVELGQLQFGTAAGFDEYGTAGKVYTNLGLSIRKPF